MVTNQISSSFINYTYWLCTLYVLMKIFLKLCSITKQYILPKFKKPIDFKSYGRWAVITGSTDGIGKGFAKELASRGVDICLISRSEERLMNTAKEIEENYGVKTKYIVANFTNPYIYEYIKENISELDIGILVNNVGMVADDMEAFNDHSEEVVKDYINVNLMSLTRMTHLVLPCMIAKKRGLILNLSSLGSESMHPYFSQYCACKAYITMFGSCLSYEMKQHNIQVTTFISGFVSTKLVHQFTYVVKLINMILPSFIVPVDVFVKLALQSVNSGSYKHCVILMHDLFNTCSSILPMGVFSEWALYMKRKEN